MSSQNTTRLPIIIALIFVLSPFATSQNPGYLNSSNETGIPEYGSFIHTNIDSINLQNGGLNVNIPFFSRSMRGFSVSAGVRYDSKYWIVDSYLDSNPPARMIYQWKGDGFAGWQKSSNLDKRVEFTEHMIQCPAEYMDDNSQGGFEFPDGVSGGTGGQIQTVPPGTVAIRANYVMTIGDGTKYTFPVRRFFEVHTPGEACRNYRPNPTFFINNFKGHSPSAHFELDLTQMTTLTLASQFHYTLRGKDGLKAQHDPWNPNTGARFWQIDTNGNKCCDGDSEGWMLDNLGRRLYKWSTPSLGIQNFQYYDSEGTARTIVVEGQEGAFGGNGQCTAFPTTMNFIQGCGGGGFSKVTLANGQNYQFFYEDDPNEPGIYGELTKIILPSGGYIKYKFATVAERDPKEFSFACGGCTEAVALDARVVVEKRISDGAGPERVWTYAYTSVNNSGTLAQTTTVTDPEGNQELHTFAGNTFGRIREISVVYKQGANTPLKKVENAWAWENGLVSAGIPQFDPAGVFTGGIDFGDRNDRIVRSTVTLMDTGAVSKTETDYADCFAYDAQGYSGLQSFNDCRENPTTIREYDYGLTLKRSTVNAYLHNQDSAYDQAHIWDNVSETNVYAGAPTGTPASRTINTYGSAVTATSGVPYHDPVSTPRGNLISVANWRSDNNTWPTTTNAYNDVGNVISTTDTGGHVTQFDYTDNFTDGGNRNSQGFLTRVTLPQTGTVAHVERKQYFWHTGLTAAECGQNYPAGTVCSWSSNPTQPDHFTFSYDLLNRPITVKNGGGGSRSFQYFTNSARMDKAVAAGTYTESVVWDGLGRVTQKQINSATPAPILQDTYYDAGGKVWKTSAPYYSNDPSKGYLTRNDYDALGRVTQVTTEADGNFITNSYLGNEVTVTDQTGRQRKSKSDAFGQLIEVREPNENGSLIYQTDYRYDVLGNLLGVDQRGNDGNSANWRSRRFTYNSLSQLLTANNPETGTISYTYNTEGSLASKTDARGIMTNHSYDAIHRLTQKSYSDSTILAGYDYDSLPGWTLQNAVGRLTRMRRADHSDASIFSYDALGRVVLQYTNRASSYDIDWFQSSASYHLDGSVAWLKYPSGRKVTFGYDAAARLNNVSMAEFDGTPAPYNYWNVPANMGGQPGYHPNGPTQYEVLASGVVSITGLNSRLQPNHFAVAGATVFSDKWYEYYESTGQNNGNVQRIEDWTPGSHNHGRTQHFTYDKLNRISAASEGPFGNQSVGRWGQSFTIDPWSNLTQQTTTKGTLTAFSAAVNGKNQIVGQNYDAAGNQLSDGIHNYTFDAESRLKSVDSGAAIYTYDADGMRVRKQTGSEFTEYIYFGSQVIAEKNQAGDWSDYIYAGGKRIAKVDNFDNRIIVHGQMCSNCGWQYAGFDFPAASSNIGYVVRAGDKLQWRQYQNSTACGGLDISFTDGVRTAYNVLDQDGQWINADTIRDQWHNRRVDLSQFAGKTIGSFRALLEGCTLSGTFGVFYGDISLASTDGKVQSFYNRESAISLSAWGSAGATNLSSWVDHANGLPGEGISALNVQYYHADHLGSAQLMTSAGGWPVSSSTITPYGQEINPTATTNHYKFTGKERDAESGFDYFGARYYSNRMGRFLTPDEPFADQHSEDPQSWNLYGYVRNQPISAVDPDGRGMISLLIKAAWKTEQARQTWNAVKQDVKTVFSSKASAMERLDAAGSALSEVVLPVSIQDGKDLGDAAGEGLAKIDEAGNVAALAVTTYQTYTKTNPDTGEVYAGHTSGEGTPKENLARRDTSHHKNKEGFGPAVLDKSSKDKGAIVGREQLLKEKYQKQGRSGNAINPISDRNKNKSTWIEKAKKLWGKV